MRELEQRSVEQLTIRFQASACSSAAVLGSVNPIAEHRHPDLGEMETDLVLPSGLELDLEERRLAEALAHPPASARLERRLAGAGDAPPASDVLGVDR
jgi:hypothetical protein